MTRILAATMLTGLAFAAASAQEAVTIKLKERGEGETAFISKTEVRNFNLKIVDAKGKTLTDERDRTADVKEYKETILKRVGDQLPTKLEREYAKAQLTKAGITQEWPIVGKTIVIEKKDQKYTFAFKNGGSLTGTMADALAREFSRHSDKEIEFETLMLPRGPVKPGDTWKLDMGPIVKDMSRGGDMDLSTLDARGSGTLVRTYMQDGQLFGVMSFKLEIPIKGLGKSTRPVRFADGARIISDSQMDLCIDGKSDSGVIRSTITIRGDATPSNVKGITATLNIIDELVQIRKPAGK
jgi:hypothetical protein